MAQNHTYSYLILDGNIAIVYDDAKELWQSRPFRLYTQAMTAAKDYIAKLGDEPPAGATLVVQKLSVDPDTLFSRRSK